jgi:hypothetical protein
LGFYSSGFFLQYRQVILKILNSSRASTKAKMNRMAEGMHKLNFHKGREKCLNDLGPASYQTEYIPVERGCSF